jgi:hypothetical protein
LTRICRPVDAGGRRLRPPGRHIRVNRSTK